MIQSFYDRGTEDVFNRVGSKEARRTCPSIFPSRKDAKNADFSVVSRNNLHFQGNFHSHLFNSSPSVPVFSARFGHNLVTLTPSLIVLVNKATWVRLNTSTLPGQDHPP